MMWLEHMTRGRLALAALALTVACGEPPEETGEPQASEPCGADERVEGGACAPCPVGATNEAGDDPDGADTQCDVAPCAEDERVLANACSACPMGSTNAAGDDPTRGNTRCDPILCDSDERVSSFTCVPCPDGLVNEKGDEASGPDTQCDDPNAPDPTDRAIDRGCVFDAQPACLAADADRDYGDCGEVIGYAFDGASCAPVSGCPCEGDACPPFATSGECARSCGSTGWCREDLLDGLPTPSCEVPACVGQDLVACVASATDPAASVQAMWADSAVCVQGGTCGAGEWECRAGASFDVLGQDGSALLCGATLHEDVTAVRCADPDE